MAGDWEEVELKELIDRGRGISYGIVQPGAPVQGGVPIVRVSDVRNGRISTVDPLRVAPEIESAYARTRLRGGELLLTLVGTVGEAAVVPETLVGWNTARAVAVIPVCPEIGGYWVKIALGSRGIRQIIDSRLNTTVQATLNLRDVSCLPIVLPPRREREAIVGVLGALDDKIELNRRMNRTLEAIGRAIFKSWFVDFDPVHANARGRSPRPLGEGKGEGLPGLDPATAALFPDRFTESPPGPIPAGWEASRIKDEFRLTMGQSPPGETYNEEGGGLPFFQGRTDFGFRFPKRRVFCTAPNRLAEPGDTLVSVRAPVGDINMATERCCVGRGVAAIRHNSGSRSYTYYAMQALREEFVAFEAHGTVFGAMGRKDFENVRCLRPPAQMVAKFDQLVSPIDDRIAGAERESATLASMRDALLPKLLSGELRVGQAEQLVGEVVE